jgi:hypothetical protein
MLEARRSSLRFPVRTLDFPVDPRLTYLIPEGKDEKRNEYRLLAVKSEAKRPLGRPRLRWVDNIRMDLLELGWGDVDWIGLAEDRNYWKALVNSVLNIWVP